MHALFQSPQHIYEKREGAGAGSKSVPLMNGSGSGRPKNMRILRIRFLIRIPNTARNEPGQARVCCGEGVSYVECGELGREQPEQDLESDTPQLILGHDQLAQP
jgi:hypothetical protein